MNKKKQLALKTIDLTKTFEATIAVKNASVEVFKGEIRGLVGENGSGKTTLVSMISGILRPDSGTMEKGGKEYKPDDVISANRDGVGIILQEMGTIDGLTIAQNIFFGLESDFTRAGFLNSSKMNSHAERLLEKYGLKGINPSADITELSFEERKLTEFAKALYIDPSILIVDETTTALSQDGRKLLFSFMHDFKDRGKTIIFITHEMHELFEHCNNVTIMRDGEIICTEKIDELKEEKVKSLMVGRKFTENNFYKKDFVSSETDETVFKVENLTKKGSFNDIGFYLKKGEILGIGGLTNCGMHELGKALYGIEKPDSGNILLYKNGEERKILNTPDAVKNKIAYISKNRDQESIMLTSSITDNIVLPGINLLEKYSFISPKKRVRYAELNTKQLSVKMRDVNQLVMYLSGGNKQKVAISKWLANGSQLFIMDCPTRGIDVAVKEAIYEIMRDFKTKGCSLIMISEELPELIGMSDRIIIIRKGMISGEIERGRNYTEEYLLNYMI